jgi:hypothetical protein
MLSLLTLSFGTSGCVRFNSGEDVSYAKHAVNYSGGLDGQMSSLTQQLANRLMRYSHYNVEVRNIVNDEGESGRLEYYLAEELSSRLSRYEKMKVYDVASEAYDAPKSSQSGDESIEVDLEVTGQAEVGLMAEALGAIGSLYARIGSRVDVSLVGKTFYLPNGVKLMITMVKAEDGEVLGTASTLIPIDETVANLMEDRAIQSSVIKQYDGVATGKVVRTSDNQYIELIPKKLILYVKQINYEYNLFSDKSSSVEFYLNNEYQVMDIGDMLDLSIYKERYVLSLRRIAGHNAVFTFANVSRGVPLSPPVDEDSDDSASDETAAATDEAADSGLTLLDGPASNMLLLVCGVAPWRMRMKRGLSAKNPVA